MAAHIVKPMDISAFIPDNDYAFTGDCCGEVIPGLCDLGLVSNQYPMPGENLIPLLSKSFR